MGSFFIGLHLFIFYPLGIHAIIPKAVFENDTPGGTPTAAPIPEKILSLLPTASEASDLTSASHKCKCFFSLALSSSIAWISAITWLTEIIVVG